MGLHCIASVALTYFSCFNLLSVQSCIGPITCLNTTIYISNCKITLFVFAFLYFPLFVYNNTYAGISCNLSLILTHYLTLSSPPLPLL